MPPENWAELKSGTSRRNTFKQTDNFHADADDVDADDDNFDAEAGDVDSDV